MDYEVINIRTKKTLRVLEKVKRIENIPNNCLRVYFENGGSCKIKSTTYELRFVYKKN